MRSAHLLVSARWRAGTACNSGVGRSTAPSARNRASGSAFVPSGHRRHARSDMFRKILGITFAAALLGGLSAAGAADKASEKFIKEAVEGNLAEVQVGQLAQQKGESEGVKTFGGQLQKDHS